MNGATTGEMSETEFDARLDDARDKDEGHTDPAPETADSDVDEYTGPRVWLATDLRPASPQRWLVRRRIPADAVSLLVGDEGIGKSLFWVLIVAAMTTGKALPEIGLPARAPGTVVLVLTEDDWSSTVLPRLIVAGADITKIVVICEEDDGSGSPYFPNHMGIIEEAAQSHSPDLVVVDAWLDTVPSGINVKDPHGARQALHPWKNFATHYETAVLLLTHTNRVSTGNARDKYGITAELRKKVRMSLFAQRDDESGELLIGPEKSNLVGDVPASKFTIRAVQHFPADEDTDGTVPELVYAGEHESTSREIIATKFEDESGAVAEDWTAAEKWLHDVLAVEGELPSKDIKARAQKEKISERTLQRAAKKLRLEYPEAGFPRVTSWTLPADHHCDVCAKQKDRASGDSRASDANDDPVSLERGATGATGDDLHKHNGVTVQSRQSRQSRQPQTHTPDSGVTGGKQEDCLDCDTPDKCTTGCKWLVRGRCPTCSGPLGSTGKCGPCITAKYNAASAS